MQIKYLLLILMFLTGFVCYSQGTTKVVVVKSMHSDSVTTTAPIVLKKVKNGYAFTTISLDCSNGSVWKCQVKNAMYDRLKKPGTNNFYDDSECLTEVWSAIKTYVSKLRFERADGLPFTCGQVLRLDVPIE